MTSYHIKCAFTFVETYTHMYKALRTHSHPLVLLKCPLENFNAYDILSIHRNISSTVINKNRSSDDKCE